MRLLTVGFELCSAGSRGLTAIKMSDQSVLLNKCLQTAYLSTAIYDERSLQMLPIGCIRAASFDRSYLRQRNKTNNSTTPRAFFITRFAIEPQNQPRSDGSAHEKLEPNHFVITRAGRQVFPGPCRERRQVHEIRTAISSAIPSGSDSGLQGRGLLDERY